MSQLPAKRAGIEFKDDVQFVRIDTSWHSDRGLAEGASGEAAAGLNQRRAIRIRERYMTLRAGPVR